VSHWTQPLSPDSSVQYAMNVPLNQRRVWPVYRVRHLRRSELEVDLDSQEDGENETLSENPWTLAHGRGLC